MTPEKGPHGPCRIGPGTAILMARCFDRRGRARSGVMVLGRRGRVLAPFNGARREAHDRTPRRSSTKSDEGSAWLPSPREAQKLSPFGGCARPERSPTLSPQRSGRLGRASPPLRKRSQRETGSGPQITGSENLQTNFMGFAAVTLSVTVGRRSPATVGSRENVRAPGRLRTAC